MHEVAQRRPPRARVDREREQLPRYGEIYYATRTAVFALKHGASITPLTPPPPFFLPFTRSTFPSSTRCIVLLSEDAPPGASSKLLIPKRRGSDQCLSCCLPLSHVTLIVTAAANFISHFVGARCLSSFLPAIPFFIVFVFSVAAILRSEG